MPPSKMEAKVTSLEGEITSLRNVSVTIQSRVKENHENLLTMLKQHLTLHNTKDLGNKRLYVDPVDEFQLLVKKVELPMFML